MSETKSNRVPCCVTDFSSGRIWWEWRQEHWIRVKPDTGSRLLDGVKLT
jgi:hypothetical protein